MKTKIRNGQTLIRSATVGDNACFIGCYAAVLDQAFKVNLMIDVDVLIVGGGLVGSTLAAALCGTGISVALVDSTDLYGGINSEFDGRSFAVSLASHRVLSGVGIGQHLGEDQSPIRDIRISDGPSLMFLHFDHRDAGGEPMGYMIENHSLRRAQYKRLIKAEDLIIRSPDSVVRLCRNAYGVTAELASGARLKAKLLVGADGRDSRVRSDAGIPLTKWEYNQAGIVCTVRHDYHHNNIAHERFLPSGPFAILPLKGNPPEAGNRSSLVWTEVNELIPNIINLNDQEFIGEISQRFGDFLGNVELAGPRYTFPLALQFAKNSIDRRLVLIGDAASAMHPIAGQGFNMGLRDVAALAEVLVDAVKLGLDIGEDRVLQKYVRWRRFDTNLMLAATDGLNRLFSNNLGPARLARDLGLAAVNRCPPLKRFFVRHAMGLVGNLPRLLRGDSLV